MIMLDPVFVDLMVQLQSKLPTVKGFIILTDRQHMPKHGKLNNMHCYEELLQASWRLSSCTLCVHKLYVHPCSYGATIKFL